MQEVRETNNLTRYGLIVALKQLGEAITRVKSESNNPDKDSILSDLKQTYDESKAKLDEINQREQQEMKKDWTLVGKLEDEFLEVGSSHLHRPAAIK